VFDLHAPRHTFGTRLIAAGADIKTVQALMRHSTPVLTLGIYVHSDRARLRQAVEQLPAIEVGSSAQEEPARTAVGAQ
jgi:site-specific recombinase XerD